MIQRPGHARLYALLRQYVARRRSEGWEFTYLICLPAVLFSVLGMLVAINFGISLIAIAIAILHYCQFGQQIGAGLGAVLLLMLAIWLLVMPAHHLVAASLAISLIALTGAFFSRFSAGYARLGSFGYRQSLIAGPVYALLLFRAKMIKKPG
jgi:hypothetical protein